MHPRWIKTGFLVTLVLLGMANTVLADDDDDDSSSDDEDTPKSCYKYTTDFLQSTVNTVLKCIGPKSNFKAKNIFEYGTRFYCILKCVLQELGTVDSAGRFDDIAAAFFFEENFAPEVQETLLPSVQACFALAEQFDDKDYWCKTYAPFVTCLIKALVPANVAYSSNCFTSPIISIVFSIFTSITPNPIIQNEVNELKRILSKHRPIKCLNRNCTTKYKIERKNGVSSIILYDRNMTEISRQLKLPKNRTDIITVDEPSQIQSFRAFKSDRYL